MIKSMTGYGRSNYICDNREYSIEIKSVNHKYNDISIKMPRTISFLEENVRKEVLKNVSRGKLDVYINFINNSEKGKNISINKELAKIYIQQLQELAEETNIKNDISVINVTKFPDVLTIQNDEMEDELWNELKIALNQAIENFVAMRQQEGEKIKLDLETRINNINDKIEKICILSTGLVEEYIVKLKNRIKELMQADVIDETRIAQEIVIYADKSSVQEEITRLRSHIHQFKTLLNEKVPVGKKLDFIIQEMNRETNTIGSKANSLEITNLVVELKTEIEDIREQVQNIE